MSALARLFGRFGRGRNQCVPTAGCMPLRRPRDGADGGGDSDDDYGYGDTDSVASSVAPVEARPLVLTVPGTNCPVLVDSVFETRIENTSSVVTHVGEWTDISLFESTFHRAPARICRSEFSRYVRDANMHFEVGESHGLKLKHDEWYMRHHMAPTVAAYVTIICVKNEGMAGISVNNTKFLKTNMQEGDVLVVPAARSVFFLPQVGGDAEYIIVTLVPTAELCDLGFEVFPPSIDQEAQVRVANVAETRRKACKIVNQIVKLRVDLEKCYYEICNLVIMITEFNARYNDVGAQMITASVDAIARGMGGAAQTALCRQSLRGRRPLSAALTRNHSILEHGITSLFAVFAQTPEGTPHPDSLMARMERDLRELYSKFSELWDDILQLASDLDSTLPRCECIERYIHHMVCVSEAGVKRNELVQRLTMIAGAGYRLTGSGEGVPV
ncbi:hypothetical protein 01orf_00002 [Orf virus]|nr:hypothetical protein 01orf_00002 [Orf virus]